MNHRTAQFLVLGTLSLSLLAPSRATALDWPQWRGPDRTDLSKETGLLKKWPEGGPKQVWIYKDAGKGYAGPAIVGGKLYTMGTRDESEVLLALDANTGKELWAAKLGKILGNKWGDGPRGTPAVAGDRVYALGGQGSLICAQAKDGQIIWQRTMQELGGTVPFWGYTESVLVDGNQVVCSPGGPQGAIVAFDKATGKTLWQSKELTDNVHYSSLIAAEHNGQHQYIKLTEKSVAGVAAKDGKLLWRSDWPGKVAVIPTPIFKDGFVYVSAGYGAGCKLIKLEAGGQATDVYDNKVMKNHHGGVILVGEHLYGHSDGPGWVCQNFKTGAEVWAAKNLGKGAIGYADGMFYCVDEGNGTVALIDASPQGWQEHGRFKLDPQSTIRSHDGRIWTHPVIVNGKLYLRDQDLIYCYDVKK